MLKFLTELRENSSTGELLWRADEVDSLGNVIRSTLAGGVTEHSSIDRTTGYLEMHQVKKANGTMFINQDYNWDAAGNLLERIEHHLNRKEVFTYDELYRLKTTTLSNINGNLPAKTESYRYDIIGNLIQKGDRFSEVRISMIQMAILKRSKVVVPIV